MTVYSPLEGLLHFEQMVNSRFRAASAPDLPAELLPETGSRMPLHWVSLPAREVLSFPSGEHVNAALIEEVKRGDSVLMPVHPLDTKMYARTDLIESGILEFSASYRTCVYTPEAGGPFSDRIPEGQLLMIKLHLEQPLPGIPGDRRLPAERIEKCVTLSDTICSEVKSVDLAQNLKIVPEFFGISHPTRGALFRLLPAQGIMPVFSLYSTDRTAPDRSPILYQRMRHLFGSNRRQAAESFGAELARPLLSSLLSAFARGISLEMHAQNTLVSLGEQRLIHEVWFRDLEGVIVFNELRARLGLPALFEDSGNPELIGGGHSAQRFYNRNVDHDLGRIFDGAVTALSEHGYFDRSQCEIARKSIAAETTRLAESSGLGFLNRWGALFPFSRAPWGNGTRLGHYFSTRFR